MDQQKLDFISTGLVPLLKTLPADAAGRWGKMNAQQMVEHIAGFFRLSTGKLHFPSVTPIEQLPKFKAFLYSDKEFRENTKAPMLPEEPMTLRFAGFADAVDDLDMEVKNFLHRFSNEPGLKAQHPVFGDLDFEGWVLLHYKHVVHHLKQFGLIGPQNTAVNP